MTDTLTLAGLGLAATGAAHFIAPDSFEALTSAAFPEDTAAWISINGACELALGLGIAAPPTRKAALVGLAGYVGHLVYRGGTAVRAGTAGTTDMPTEPGTLHSV